MPERRSNEQERHLSDEAYHLRPGYVFYSADKSAIRTIVGNSVAVCIWDKKLRQGGMSHFMYPSTDLAEKYTPKYGNVSTITLLKSLKEAGSRSQDLEAQIVGGANYQYNDDNIGARNIKSARNTLNKYNITIISEDIKGKLGRKIIFDLESGELLIVKVKQIRESDWIKSIPK